MGAQGGGWHRAEGAGADGWLGECGQWAVGVDGCQAFSEVGGWTSAAAAGMEGEEGGLGGGGGGLSGWNLEWVLSGGVGGKEIHAGPGFYGV